MPPPQAGLDTLSANAADIDLSPEELAVAIADFEASLGGAALGGALDEQLGDITESEKPSVTYDEAMAKVDLIKKPREKIPYAQKVQVKGTSRTKTLTLSEDIVELYLSDIGRYPLLNKAQEQVLGSRVQNAIAAENQLKETAANGVELTDQERKVLEATIRDGQEARKDFINANLRLVVSIAHGYPVSVLPLMDIVQEGNKGLIRAVEKFNPDKGFKFSTYATLWVKQAIRKALGSTGYSVHLPQDVYDRTRSLAKAKSTLAQDLGREPRHEEIQTFMGIGPEDYQFLLDSQEVANMDELDRPVSDDAKSKSPGDMYGDPKSTLGYELVEDEIMRGASQDRLGRMLESLTSEERSIVTKLFGLDWDEPRVMAEVAKEMGVGFYEVQGRWEKIRLKLQRQDSLNTLSEYCNLDEAEERIFNLYFLMRFPKYSGVSGHTTRQAVADVCDVLKVTLGEERSSEIIKSVAGDDEKLEAVLKARFNITKIQTVSFDLLCRQMGITRTVVLHAETRVLKLLAATANS